MKRLLHSGCWLLLLIPLILQFVTVHSRGIDPDEFEHLHAAFSVWNGLLPYRDFFEHHSPALYYLLQPAFWIYGPELNVLWLGRAIMCVMSCATVAMTWRLARHWKGEFVAWTGSLLLAWSSVFVLKGSELRPDVPACLCLTWMTYLTVRAFDSPRFRDWLGIGLLGGVATLFTQKSIVPVVALAVSVVVARGMYCRPAARDLPQTFPASEHRAGSWISLKHMLPFMGIGLGGSLIWGLLLLTFARYGALNDLLAGAVLQLVRMPIQSERWEHLRPTIAADFTLWLAGGFLLVLAFREAISRKGDARSIVVAGTLAGSLVSLTWVKAVYPQYVLLWLPVLAIAAARCLEIVKSHTNSRVRYVILGLGIVVCVLECKLLFDGLRGTHPTALSHVRELWNSWQIPAAAVVVLPVSLIVWCVCLSRSTTRSQWMILPLAILGMSYAVARDANSWLWPNRTQVALIERVNSLVSLDDTVLDGFAGYGALRPHASYFWWINRYSLALMTEQDKTKLRETLQQHPPTVILYDHELQSWPPIEAPIKAAYQPTANPPIWIRQTKQNTDHVD
ncbi:MAG: glycosyltransferase family 39 protein [Planctomycetota bacterium]